MSRRTGLSCAVGRHSEASLPARPEFVAGSMFPPKRFHFRLRERPRLAYLQIADLDVPDARPDEFEYGCLQGLHHASHLPIPSLGDRDFEESVLARIPNP